MNKKKETKNKEIKEKMDEQFGIHNFINEKKELLRQSIEGQFPSQTVHSSMVTCMTQEEVDNLKQQTMGEKWQGQKHI